MKYRNIDKNPCGIRARKDSVLNCFVNILNLLDDKFCYCFAIFRIAEIKEGNLSFSEFDLSGSCLPVSVRTFAGFLFPFAVTTGLCKKIQY